MKKEDIPQDPSALGRHTKEVCYVVDNSGKYVTGLSTGWEIKATALGVAWQDIEVRVKEAKEKVLRGEASPILYFMEAMLMDIGILSAYTGFWQWRIKRHLKPSVFNKMSKKNLERYAAAFEVTVENLKNMKANQDGI